MKRWMFNDEVSGMNEYDGDLIDCKECGEIHPPSMCKGRVRSTVLLSRPVHPEEYRYRITKFHRSIEQIIQQKLLIDNLWPKPFSFEKDGVTYVFNRGERPKEVEELDAYLSESINNAFREIVVEGK